MFEISQLEKIIIFICCMFKLFKDYNRIIQVIKIMIKHVDKLESFEDKNGHISASLLNSIDDAQAE